MAYYKTASIILVDIDAVNEAINAPRDKKIRFIK